MKKIIFTVLICIFTLSSFSNERNFTYVYQSGVLGKGNKELEIWTTARVGKDIPYYARLDHRMEFEWGVTNNLQTAFYLNFRNVSQDNGSGQTTAFRFQGFSSEWKYQFTKPSKDPLGFALYGEVGLNTDEAEIEAKVILDKKINKSIFALNLVYENEWHLSSVSSEPETILEGDFGWCYKISNSFSAGLEFRNHNQIVAGELKHSALFAGPVFSYSQPEWWATLTILPQVAAFKGETGSSNLVLDELEKFETRLLFSFRL